MGWNIVKPAKLAKLLEKKRKTFFILLILIILKQTKNIIASKTYGLEYPVTFNDEDFWNYP